MSDDSSSGGAIDTKRLAGLIQQLRQAPHATTDERTAKDQLLDELQDVVGLSGKMVTEADIMRRAEKLLQRR